jgi:hypothetical protein
LVVSASAAKLGLQGIEPLPPEMTVTREPFVEFGKRFRLQSVHAALAVGNAVGESRVTQDSQVP